MKKKILVLTLLAFGASALYAQVGILGGDGVDGPRLMLSGELLGMYTLGFAGDDQLVEVSDPMANPVGVFDNINNGRNGFMTRMDMGIRFLPVSWIDLYVQFRARSRPGSPYIPLTLEAAGADDFALSFEKAWAGINIIGGLGLDVPFDLYVRAGLMDSAPNLQMASREMVSRFGTENVVSRVRTKNVPSVQLEGVFQVPFAESVSVVMATHQRMNEAIPPLFDVDGDVGAHGTPPHDELFALPLFAALRVRHVETGFGPLYAELVYGLNAENIFSGHNLGVRGRWDISIPGMENMTVPLGLGVSLLEKNIDPMARAAHGHDNDNALSNRPYDHLNPGRNYNFATVSFRRSLRIGAGLGLRWDPAPGLSTEFNFGFSYSQIAHIYRDTLRLNSLSFDTRVTLDGNFFIGGGVFLGTLGNAEWRTSDGVDPNREAGFSHVFRLAENMGFEVHAGLNMGRSRFVLGYNANRGLSMNHGIEAMSDAQIIFRQRGAAVADDLFETRGFFTKLVIVW